MEFKLIIKKLNNTLSKEEEKLFDKWYDESELHKNYFKQVQENYLKDKTAVDVEMGWKIVNSQTGQTRRIKYRFLLAAASVALLISFSLFFFKKDRVFPEEKIPSTIAIGTTKAILTLEDGSNIALGDGKTYQTKNLSSTGEQIIYNQGINTPIIELAYNYLFVPRGGNYFIKLSDGTKVWLNSDSRLKYPVKFMGNSRKVELIYGEAYFEVSPSTQNQGANFVVSTRGQEVEVLGTQFNIKAYNEENTITTTLVEGKVAVKNKLSGEKVNLAVLHQLELNLIDNSFEMKPVDIANEISWKDGVFKFKNKPLKEIMTILSRWYDAEVIFEDADIQEILFNGVFNKNQNIQSILDIIKSTGEAHYRIEGNTIWLEKTDQ